MKIILGVVLLCLSSAAHAQTYDSAGQQETQTWARVQQDETQDRMDTMQQQLDDQRDQIETLQQQMILDGD